MEAKPEAVWEVRSGQRRLSVSVKGMYTTTSITNAAQAAQQGLGIAMLPMHLAEASSSADRRLVQVLPEWEGAPASIFAITARQHRLARVSAMLRWVRSQAPERLLELDGRTLNS